MTDILTLARRTLTRLGLRDFTVIQHCPPKSHSHYSLHITSTDTRYTVYTKRNNTIVDDLYFTGLSYKEAREEAIMQGATPSTLAALTAHTSAFTGHPFVLEITGSVQPYLLNLNDFPNPEDFLQALHSSFIKESTETQAFRELIGWIGQQEVTWQDLITRQFGKPLLSKIRQLAQDAAVVVRL